MKKLFSTLIIVFIVVGTFAQQKSDTSKNVKAIAIPTLSYNNSFGLQLGAMAMLSFDVSKKDTISPTSTLFGMGFYTTNDTWFTVLANKLYLKEDTWRMAWAIGKGNINFQVFLADIPGMEGVFIDYVTTTKFVFVEGTRKVYDRLYFGVNFLANTMNTEFDLEDLVGTKIDSTKTLIGIGLPLVWDSRDSQFYPESGLNINVKTTFNKKWLGSDLDYNTMRIDGNYYKRIITNGILASRATIYTGLGEVPFEGYQAVGRNDIRGYSNGKHRGNQIYTMQSEYRHLFPNKFGYVAFFGLAAAVNTMEEGKATWSGILPGAGAGVRYMAIPSRKMTIGIDAAVGIEDWGVYFRIGEAF